MGNAALLYMPVIHRGYLNFLEKSGTGNNLCYLIGKSALSELGEAAQYILRKDLAIRGLPDEIISGFVQSRRLFRTVYSLNAVSARMLEADSLIGPDEDVTHIAAEKFFPGVPVVYDNSTRLRYDRKGIDRVDPIPDATPITRDEVHKLLMGKARDSASKSRDWWLSVGAVLTKDGEPLLYAYNQAMPDKDLPAILGDPRSVYSRGENPNDTLVLHAERSLIAQAACKGIPLEGADMYCTHFPCGPCAAEVAEVGIRRLFFGVGYSKLEGLEKLQAKGIEIFRVV